MAEKYLESIIAYWDLVKENVKPLKGSLGDLWLCIWRMFTS